MAGPDRLEALLGAEQPHRDRLRAGPARPDHAGRLLPEAAERARAADRGAGAAEQRPHPRRRAARHPGDRDLAGGGGRARHPAPRRSGAGRLRAVRPQHRRSADRSVLQRHRLQLQGRLPERPRLRAAAARVPARDAGRLPRRLYRARLLEPARGAARLRRAALSRLAGPARSRRRRDAGRGDEQPRRRVRLHPGPHRARDEARDGDPAAVGAAHGAPRRLRGARRAAPPPAGST